jgi:ankyrin repeat protein
MLLDAGAEINAVDAGEHFTALMMAAAEGNAEVVKVLLDRGAKKDMVDSDGDAAIDFARRSGHGEIVALLSDE